MVRYSFINRWFISLTFWLFKVSQGCSHMLFTRDGLICKLLMSQTIDYQHGHFLLLCFYHPADAAVLPGYTVIHFLHQWSLFFSAPLWMPDLFNSFGHVSFGSMARCCESNMIVILHTKRGLFYYLSESDGLWDFTADLWRFLCFFFCYTVCSAWNHKLVTFKWLSG